MAFPQSLAILGCSQRKNRTPQLIPAVERYDGPLFRVLRKHAQDSPHILIDTCVLSARFGLIPGKSLIPWYEQRLGRDDYSTLIALVEKQLKQVLHELQPERLFVSVGSQYWLALEDALTREVPPRQLVVASGSIGGRASHLAHWLGSSEVEDGGTLLVQPAGRAVLLGTMVRLTREEVLQAACNALSHDQNGARRFESWYVQVGTERVAPKWLVSVLFDKPVSRFRTADARRVLSLLGVECKYAHR